MSKLFLFKDIDTHYLIVFMGIKLTIRHKSRFCYKPCNAIGVTQSKRDVELIVSLTSFPARIKEARFTINTLLRQNLKPDRVILWLSENQFPNKEKDLPEELIKLKEFGLEIDWFEDIKSYKKLVPALIKYPDSIIVTADDDMLYKEDWLEGLYSAYLKNPENIYTRRGCRIKEENGKLSVIKPRDYNFEYNFPTDCKNLLMGGAGTLYPPNSLHRDIFNIEQIKTLIPTHDDIYFWIMAVLNKTPIGVVGGFDYSFNYGESSKINALCNRNQNKGTGLSSSDALKKVVERYPELIEILKNS